MDGAKERYEDKERRKQVLIQRERERERERERAHRSKGKLTWSNRPSWDRFPLQGNLIRFIASPIFPREWEKPDFPSRVKKNQTKIYGLGSF